MWQKLRISKTEPLVQLLGFVLKKTLGSSLLNEQIKSEQTKNEQIRRNLGPGGMGTREKGEPKLEAMALPGPIERKKRVPKTNTHHGHRRPRRTLFCTGYFPSSPPPQSQPIPRNSRTKDPCQFILYRHPCP